MFGLSQLFAAISRLTTSFNRMADFVDTANAQIEARLTHAEDRAPAPAIEADPAPHEANGTTTRKPAKGRA